MIEAKLVHCCIFPNKIKDISEKGVIGSEPREALLKQIPLFANVQGVFCNYTCKGYPKVYGSQGVIFETDERPLYACPVDSWELMREGNYIPGYEQFIFKSIEEMLKKYPSVIDFKKDFSCFFKSLNPEEIWPHQSLERAKMNHRTDYTLFSSWLNGESCNEIFFKAPLDVKVISTFDNHK